MFHWHQNRSPDRRRPHESQTPTKGQGRRRHRRQHQRLHAMRHLHRGLSQCRQDGSPPPQSSVDDPTGGMGNGVKKQYPLALYLLPYLHLPLSQRGQTLRGHRSRQGDRHPRRHGKRLHSLQSNFCRANRQTGHSV